EVPEGALLQLRGLAARDRLGNRSALHLSLQVRMGTGHCGTGGELENGGVEGDPARIAAIGAPIRTTPDAPAARRALAQSVTAHPATKPSPATISSTTACGTGASAVIAI